MSHDALIDEVRAIRDAIAREHDYDLDSIFRMFRDREARSRAPHVTLSPRRSAGSDPADAPQQSNAAADGSRSHPIDRALMISFPLRLEDTYWLKGFFNVSVDFERYLTTIEGPIDIFLGDDAQPLTGRISRSAQANGTPRVYGNKPLASFFQLNFKRGDFVSVDIISPESVRIGRGASRR